MLYFSLKILCRLKDRFSLGYVGSYKIWGKMWEEKCEEKKIQMKNINKEKMMENKK